MSEPVIGSLLPSSRSISVSVTLGPNGRTIEAQVRRSAFLRIADGLGWVAVTTP